MDFLYSSLPTVYKLLLPLFMDMVMVSGKRGREKIIRQSRETREQTFE
jgi:hypothetical protein